MFRDRRPLPVDPEFWQWWISRHEEGPWEPAGKTREIAIDEALDQDVFMEIEPRQEGQPWRAGFYVCLCRRRTLDLSRWFDVHEWLDEMYEQIDEENGGDENGENHPLDELTPADKAALGESVRSAIWHWQNRRGLRLSPYWLDMYGAPEWVTVPLPPEDSAT